MAVRRGQADDHAVELLNPLRGSAAGPNGPRETTDWETVARLLLRFNHEFDEPCDPPEVLVPRLERLENLRAVVTGDPPHGLVVMRIQDSMYADAPECYINEFWIAPDHRNRGEGGALLRAALDLARTAGATHAELNTDPGDHAAHHVYERAGFRRTAHYYEREL